MTDKSQTIHIIATGGTIDSKFYPPTESSKVKSNSGIGYFLEEYIKPHFNFTLDQMCMLDSSEITDEIRAKIIQKIENSDSSKIIITHGTNTMVKTLGYIEENLKINNKSVIITGAMIPMDGFCPTDAGFNLGYAIGQIKNLSSGNYIAMQGQLFKSTEVQKNFDLARFEFKENS